MPIDSIFDADIRRRIEEQELMNLDKLYALENGLVPEDYVKQKKAEREAQKPKEVPVILKVSRPIWSNFSIAY